MLEIELADGRTISAPVTAKRYGIGDEVSAGVRPEKLMIATLAGDDPTPASHADVNVVDGHVLDASYVGVSTQYLVRLADGRDMTVYAQNLETSGVSEQHPDGQRVSLSWSPKHTFVIGGRAEGEVESEGESNA
jgi:spermidine/putrescine transport system ATP-binding protein